MFQNANQVILKVTKGCNLRCKYCYVMNKDRFNEEFMSLDIFKKIVDQIIFDKLKSFNKKIILIFHGGEPTLLNKKLFYQMCEYASYNLNLYNIKHGFSIQTNLTLIDEEWCNIFSTFGFNVGFSFDGINGGNSARNSLESEFYKNKIDLLKKYNISCGCLLVVNKTNINNIEESLNYIEDVFKLKSIKMNYSEDVITDFGIESELEVSGEDYYNKAIVPQVDKYIKTGNTIYSDLEIYIEKFLRNYILNNANYNPDDGNCYVKYCGAGINVIEVGPGGTVMMCGRYGEDYPEGQMDNSLDVLGAKQIKKIWQFQKEKIKAIKKIGCDNCYAQSICDHGCMAFYLTKSKNNNKKDWGIRNDLTCKIFKPLYNYLLLNIEALYKAYFIKNKELIINTNETSIIHIQNLHKFFEKTNIEIIQENNILKLWRNNG